MTIIHTLYFISCTSFCHLAGSDEKPVVLPLHISWYNMSHLRIQHKKRKEQILSEVCMIKKQRLIVLFTSDVMKKRMFKRLVYTPPDLWPTFTCKVNFSNTKNLVWFFYFGLPFRQRNGTCKLAATEDYRVFHKIIFRGCPIIHSVSNGVVGETVN